MCGDPEQPLHSTLKRISDRHIVYACQKGYKMEGEGDPRRDCVNGVWTGHPPPRCSGMTGLDPLSNLYFSFLVCSVCLRGKKERGRKEIGRVEKSLGKNSCDDLAGQRPPSSCPARIYFDAPRKKSSLFNNVTSTMPASRTRIFRLHKYAVVNVSLARFSVLHCAVLHVEKVSPQPTAS